MDILRVLSLAASILTLTLISCDRFFGIVFALKARLTQRRWRTFIALVWAAAVAVAAPQLAYKQLFTRPWLDHTEIWCDDVWPASVVLDPATNTTHVTQPARTLYYTVVTVVIYFLPISVMSLAYAIIIWKLWSSRPPGEILDREACTQTKIKKKVILMLLVILTVFTFCWLPFQISILYAEHRLNKNDQLPPWYSDFQYFAKFLAYSNSALNPIIYTCFNNSFRRGFRETFRRSFRRRRSRSTFVTYYNTIELKSDTVAKDRHVHGDPVHL